MASRATPTHESPSLFEELEARTLLSGGWDVVLIDAGLPAAAQLGRAVVEAEHVVYYDHRKDSAANVLSHVSELALAAGRRIDSLAIVSHGAPGGFALGTHLNVLLASVP